MSWLHQWYYVWGLHRSWKCPADGLNPGGAKSSAARNKSQEINTYQTFYASHRISQPTFLCVRQRQSIIRLDIVSCLVPNQCHVICSYHKVWWLHCCIRPLIEIHSKYWRHELKSNVQENAQTSIINLLMLMKYICCVLAYWRTSK